MALPTTRRQFKDWCLREVGFPVVELEIDDQQVDDKIDYALSFYMDYHFNGIELVYLKHLITQEDKDQGFVEMSDLIQGVNGVWDVGSGFSNTSMFNFKYQFALNDMFNISSTSLIPYQAAMRHIELVSEFFASRPGIQFNRHANKLYITGTENFVPGNYLIVECYRALDPNVYADIWKDKWLLKYTSALIKKQVGEHLMKMQDVKLPGPTTYNGEKIYQLAADEVQKMEDEVIHNFSWPVMDFVG